MKKPVGILLLIPILLAPPAQAEDLAQIYQLAMDNDPTLKAVYAQLNSTKETKPQAKALLLPNISIGGDASRVHLDTQKSPTFVTGTRSFNDKSAAISLVQPVYHRDRWIQLEQTDSLIAGAEADYAAAQQDLIFRTAQAYFNILDAKEVLRAAEGNRKAIERQLDQAKQRFEVGLIAITDVYEAQAAFDGARSEEIAAQNQVNNAWEALFQVIGPVPVRELADLKAEFPLKLPQPADINQWAETAQQQNLLVIAAQNDVEFAKQNIELQRSGHYPTLDLVGSYGRDDSSGSLGSKVDTGVIGLQLSVPLYQGGGVVAATRQARYDFQGTQDILDAQRRAVNRQVHDAYRGVETSIAQVEALQATVVSAKSAVEATEAGYEVGTRTIIDVLNVQRNLFESESAYATARYSYVLRGLQLKLAASILSEGDLNNINTWLE